jgi:hypothetical protein
MYPCTFFYLVSKKKKENPILILFKHVIKM